MYICQECLIASCKLGEFLLPLQPAESHLPWLLGHIMMQGTLLKVLRGTAGCRTCMLDSQEESLSCCLV